MSRKRPRSPSPSPSNTSISISRSLPILDRASTFIAAYSPTLPASTLQAHPEFKSATHRIAAWRIPSKQRTLAPSITTGSTSSGRPAPTLYSTGHDDDGESYAGSKLARLLADLSVEGSVVVARWYGGVLLGPVRFRHIENCAREAIKVWAGEEKGMGNGGRDGNGDGNGGSLEARRKRVAGLGAGEEAAVSGKDDVSYDDGNALREASLRRILAERDASIATLRDLLAEKTSDLARLARNESAPKEKEDDGSRAIRSPAKVVDYSAMDLVTLRRREKASDATIAWILGQIDRAEEKQKKQNEEKEQKEKQQQQRRESGARKGETVDLNEPP